MTKKYCKNLALAAATVVSVSAAYLFLTVSRDSKAKGPTASKFVE